MYVSLCAIFLGLVGIAKAVVSCPEDAPLSCSESSKAVDSCCAFSPGILELLQVWNKERQQWIIQEIRTLSCDNRTSYSSCGPSYLPEKILGLVEGYVRHREPMTNVSRTLGWGGISSDASDDDVARIWARQWEQTGSCISTFQSKCFDKNMPPGEEDAWNDPGPALFVQMMHLLQRNLARADPPGLNELPQKWHYLHSYGSPHLGNFVEEPNMTAKAKDQQQRVGTLSFFAQRERRRADDEESRERDHSRWSHEEL
ncbi:ribonuclease T2, putative [Rhizoctonia solani AG-1 IB]|uniref:Ribonuclease T2, putative n=1 Tax=Thanatephorus cucumeris (strain AG1-IB / isolate 7/3/14) TaxID=1108050 RepID=A0A0B7F9H8_THACB|nr:ribonuclease T2, putative [Rhizoctonia solani AG-1 IB]